MFCVVELRASTPDVASGINPESLHPDVMTLDPFVNVYAGGGGELKRNEHPTKSIADPSSDRDAVANGLVVLPRATNADPTIETSPFTRLENMRTALNVSVSAGLGTPVTSFREQLVSVTIFSNPGLTSTTFRPLLVVFTLVRRVSIREPPAPTTLV